jgi:oxazoline/thiazoline synthase
VTGTGVSARPASREHVIDKPRLKAHLIPFAVDDDLVFLVAEHRHYLLRGSAPAAMMPYLDGHHTIGDIVGALAGQVSFHEILRTVSELHRAGHLADGNGCSDRRVLAAWDGRGLDPTRAADSLRTATVAVTAVGDVAMATVVTLTQECGVRVRPVRPEQLADTDSGLAVLVTDEYLDPAAGRLCMALRDRRREVLLVKPVGTEIWIGPHLVPGRTGCWHCLAQRLDSNRLIEQYIRVRSAEQVPTIRPSVGALPGTEQLAAALVSNAVTEIITTGGCSLTGAVVSLHTGELAMRTHELIRQPQCPGCGDPTATSARPARVELAASPVRFSSDGGHRAVPPRETYERLNRHISPITGIVRELRPVDQTDGITYSYAAGHNFALPGDNLALLRRTLRGLSGGKGKTDIQARTSAICEAVERYSAVWRNDRPTVHGRFTDFGDDQAVFLPALLQYSQAQYDAREEWNTKGAGGRYNQVPRPYDPELPIAWTPAWSLRDERERLVPASHVWFGHPDLYEHLMCFPDGNGNSAGNTLEEAILQGFCELVERDSVALWWYNRLCRPAVDLGSFGDPYLDELRGFYDTQGRSLWLLDLTTDLGVPAFAAVSHRIDGHPTEDIIVGFGAHLDHRMAASRALTELNQFLPVVNHFAPDGSTIYWEDDEYVLDWWQTTTMAAEPWLRPDPAAPPRRASDFRRLAAGDVRDEVRDCVRIAAEHGLDVLVTDLSRPDVELRVAKVIVPGLRHFWRRLAPGRLYDAPVRLGWLPTPLTEADMNPRSVFF